MGALPRKYGFACNTLPIHEYGPLITLRSGFGKVVVIGRYKFSPSTPSCHIQAQHSVAGRHVYYGEPVPSHAALHTHFKPKAADAYQPLQTSNVNNLIFDILDDPYNFQNHVTSYAATVITKVTYGSTAPTPATDLKSLRCGNSGN